MIQAIRDKAQGIVAWIIVGALIVIFAMWGIGNYLTSPPLKQRIVAKVNDAKITMGELSQSKFSMKQIIQTTPLKTLQQSELFHIVSAPNLLSLKQALDVNAALSLKQEQTLIDLSLNRLIDQRLLYQNAQDADLGVSRKEVSQAITSLPVLQNPQTHQFSQERFSILLQRLGMSSQSFQVYQTRNMLIAQQANGIGLSGFTLPQEQQQYLSLLNQTRDFGYMIVASQPDTQAAKITPQQISAYYQSHQSDYVAPASMRLAYVVLNYQDVVNRVKISNERATQYYQDNPQSFMKNGKALPYAQVKAQVIKQLQNTAAQREYSHLGNRMANLAFEHPTSLKQVAKDLQLPIQTSAIFTAQTGHIGILKNKAVIQAALSHSVLKQHNNSNVINISPTEAMVLRVTDYQAAKPKPLSAVHTQIQQTLARQAGAAAALKTATTLCNALAHSDASTVAKQHDLRWHTLNAATRDTTSVNASIATAAFNTPKPLPQHPINTMVTLKNGDVAIVQVTQVTPGKASTMSAKAKNGALEALQQAQLKQTSHALIQFLRAKASIHITKEAEA